MRRSLLATLIAIATLLIAGVSPAAAADTVTVSPDDMNGWFFYNDTTNTPETGVFVLGPAGQPAGVGSAELKAIVATDRHALFTAAYAGTPLSEIRTLDYWTFQSNSSHAITLQFDVHFLPAAGYQGRLVFEPGNGNAAPPNTPKWTRWNARAGRWWGSRIAQNDECGQNKPCTLDRFIQLHPTATVSGALGFKAGGGWTGFTGNVDAFTITVRSSSKTFDFEPAENDNNCDEGDDDASGHSSTRSTCDD